MASSGVTPDPLLPDASSAFATTHWSVILAAREPDASEQRLLGAFYERQRALFAGKPAEAAKLLGIGDRKPDAALPPAEVAAAAVLAQAILNVDATIWER